MFSFSEFFNRPRKSAAAASLQVVQALCDVQRPMLRREDLERINQTHQDLQNDIQTTRDQARQLAVNLSSELERAKMRVSIISDSLMDPLISVDANGVIVSTNQTVERILGFAASDLLGKSVQMLLDGGFNSSSLYAEAERYIKYVSRFKPKNIVEYRDLYRDYIKVEPSSILNKVVSVRCYTRSGEHIHAEMYINVFNVDCDNAENLIFLVVFKDATERVAATTEVESLIQFQMTLLSALPNPVFYKDADFKIIGSNRAFDIFINRQASEFIGKGNKDVFASSVVPLLDSIDQSVKDTNSPDVQMHKVEIRTDAQGLREVMMYCTALRDKEGHFKGSLATLVDLTDLLSMQRFKEALISSVPAPIYYLDRELRYKGCNDKYAALLGMPKDEILGKTREQVLFDDLKDLGILAEFYRQKDFEILTSCQAGQLYETQVFNRVRAQLIDIIVYRAVLKSPDGNFDGIVGVVTDVSEIRAVQRFHQKIFDSCPLPVFYKDKNFTYVTCNDLYARWYGMDKSVFPGKTREMLIEHLYKSAESDPKKLEVLRTIREQHLGLIAAHKENDAILAASNGSEVSVFEHQFWNFELGEIRDVIFYKHALFGQEGFEGIICNMIDVTELRRAEKIGAVLLESIPVPVAYCTSAGIVQQCNTMYSRMVGLPKSEIIGKYSGIDSLKAYHSFEASAVASAPSPKNTHVSIVELFDNGSNTVKQYTVLERYSEPSAILFIYFNKGTLHETLNLNI